MGAEALAADVLNQSMQGVQLGANGQSTNNAASNSAAGTGTTTQSGNTNQVTLAQAWAQPTQAMPITPDDNPEGEPIGVLQGAIEDMQGRFNLNNLAHVILQNGQVVQDPQPLQQFQRLLVTVGLEPKWAAIARDWIDADDQPGEPDGAEDSVYTSQTPPYRTGNWPMMSPSELMNMPGFGADRYRKIAPYVTALPTATAKINICTASAQVLQSFADNLSSDYHARASRERAQERLLPRQARPSPTCSGPPSRRHRRTLYSDTSTYFRLTTRVTLGTTEFTLYSLLYRTAGGKVTPLLRTFGTL